MRRLAPIVATLILLPLAAAAQSPGRGPPAPGAPEEADRMRRGRLAMTLGLAEALDLDEAQALKLRDVIQKQEARRQSAHAQRQEAARLLRRAADGEKVAAAEVDQAIARSFEARAALEAADRELVQSITKDLSPEKKARAALFLARFHARMGGPGMGPPDGAGRGRGPRGHGHGKGPGMGRGPGMSPGLGMGPPPGADGDPEPDDL